MMNTLGDPFPSTYKSGNIWMGTDMPIVPELPCCPRDPGAIDAGVLKGNSYVPHYYDTNASDRAGDGQGYDDMVAAGLVDHVCCDGPQVVRRRAT